jgi:hypothetical protein
LFVGGNLLKNLLISAFKVLTKMTDKRLQKIA